MAIAFDSASGSFVNPGSSHTQAHTCTGADRSLTVSVVADAGSDLITGCTYSGVSMTLIGKSHAAGGRWLYAFYLAAPATGTNNIIASASSSCFIEINAASHTGVEQTGQPEANATASNASATSLTTSVTTTTDNAWTVLCALGQAGTITAGSGSTLRNTALVGAILDSGAAVTPAGSKSMGHGQASGNFIEGWIISLAPAAGGGSSTTPLNRKLLLGVG